MTQQYTVGEVFKKAKLISFVLFITLIQLDYPSQFTLGGTKISAIFTIFVAAISLILLLSQSLNKQNFSSNNYTSRPRNLLLFSYLYLILVTLIIGTLQSDLNRNTWQNIACYLIIFSAYFLGRFYTSFKPQIGIFGIIHSGLLISSSIYISTCLTSGLGNSVVYFPRAVSMVACVGFALALTRPNISPLYRFLSISIFFSCILLSLSRTSMAVAFITVFISTLFLFRKSKLLPVTALPILIWFSTYIYELSFVKERFLFMGDQAVIGGFKINSAGRLKIWKLLVEKSSESPLFGHGIGSAEDLVIDYFGTIAQPHNEYLRVYFDFGVLGLILMLISFSSLFAANFKLRSDDLLMSWEFRLKWILLVQFLLFMSTDNPLVYPFFIFPVFFLVGFCTSTRKLVVNR